MKLMLTLYTDISMDLDGYSRLGLG